MECSIVRDLLPLYIEGLCSEETSKCLEMHLLECKVCRETYDNLSKELNSTVQKEDWEKEILPLKKFVVNYAKRAYWLYCGVHYLRYFCA